MNLEHMCEVLSSDNESDDRTLSKGKNYEMEFSQRV